MKIHYISNNNGTTTNHSSPYGNSNTAHYFSEDSNIALGELPPGALQAQHEHVTLNSTELFNLDRLELLVVRHNTETGTISTKKYSYNFKTEKDWWQSENITLYLDQVSPPFQPDEVCPCAINFKSIFSIHDPFQIIL